MRMLTVENTTFEIDEIPNEIDDIRFCVLDYPNEEEADYYFKPLLFLESFLDVKIELNIGGYSLFLPKEWSILCGPNGNDIDLIPVKKLNDIGFSAFIFNPLTSFIPEFMLIEMKMPYPKVKFAAPKLKYGQLLSLPLAVSDNPPCVYVTHNKNKVPDVLSLQAII